MLEILFQYPFLTLCLLSIIPFFGIPLVIFGGIILLPELSIWKIGAYSVLINITISIFLFYAADPIVRILEKILPFRSLIKTWKTWTTKRAHKYVQSYGLWTVAFITAIPFPNSGAYTSSFCAKVLGYRFNDFLIGVIIGSILCAALVIGFISIVLVPLQMVM